MMAPAIRQQAMADAYRQGGLSGMLSAGYFEPAAALQAAQGRADAGRAALMNAGREREWDQFAMGVGGGAPLTGGPGAALGGRAPAAQGPGGASPLDFNYALAVRSGDPDKERKAREARELAEVESWDIDSQLDYFERTDPNRFAQMRKNAGYGGWEEARSLSEKRQFYARNATEGLDAYQRLATLDVNKPAEVTYWATILMNQLFQPGNAVLLSEARESTKGLVPGLTGLFRRNVEGQWEARSDLNADELQKMRDLGLEIGQLQLNRFKEQQGAWQQEKGTFGFSDAQDITARPGYELLPIIDETLSAPISEVPTDLTPEQVEARGMAQSAAVGDTIEINGKRYLKTGPDSFREVD
jgi:hypothetical protein